MNLVLVISILVIVFMIGLIVYLLWVLTSVFFPSNSFVNIGETCKVPHVPISLAMPTWNHRLVFDPSLVYYFADMIQRMYNFICSWSPDIPPDQQLQPLLPPGWKLENIIQAQAYGTTEPFAMLLQNQTSPNVALLVIRGTVSNDDWLSDVSYNQVDVSSYFYPTEGKRQPLLVHQGFWNIYTSMSRQLKEAISQLDSTVDTLYLTGHSLGSALLWLAVADIGSTLQDRRMVYRCYPIATPRVGNPAFCSFVESLQDIDERWQFFNFSDIVPNAPAAVSPQFWHPQDPPLLYQQVEPIVVVDENFGSYLLNHTLSSYQEELFQLLK